jgi:hypothetical protein
MGVTLISATGGGAWNFFMPSSFLAIVSLHGIRH